MRFHVNKQTDYTFKLSVHICCNLLLEKPDYIPRIAHNLNRYNIRTEVMLQKRKDRIEDNIDEITVCIGTAEVNYKMSCRKDKKFISENWR